MPARADEKCQKMSYDERPSARRRKALPRVEGVCGMDVTWKQQNLSGGGYAKRVAIGGRDNFIFLVAMRLGDTPVLIPNTMVKT